MAVDIHSIQQMYGANNSHNTGNDVYSLPGSNAIGTFYQSIWDAGGTDEISASGSATAATIDLRPASMINGDPNAGGVISSVNGIYGGFTIAAGVIIENATGGSNNDMLQGNNAANRLDGGAGNDDIW